MKIEQFISEIKHPEPKQTQEVSLGTQEQLVGREKVVKVFRKSRPKTPVIDELLDTYGL